MGKIEKIFITHTHGDHIFGLAPLLASLMNGAGGVVGGDGDPRQSIDKSIPPLEIYGPLGTRAYVRSALSCTYTLLGRPYVVHELRFPDDPAGEHGFGFQRSNAESDKGRNIAMVDGLWPDIYRDEVVSVSAAPILHSVPCVGYVITEAPVPGKVDPAKYIPEIKRTKTPMSVMRQLQEGQEVVLNDGTVLAGPPPRAGRKVVILGDTFDPAAIRPLAMNAELLIHEATNAHLPDIDPNTKAEDTYESVEARAKSRGHSTPQMAGAFAKSINAKNLVLNHFSARYPGDSAPESLKIMAAIGKQAEQEYGKQVTCARDLLSIDVPFQM
ncbi:beta-lactamase-like protein [Coprinopsis sp. MPI-PUGE-AT-0042]|nr:beta-lactamase-like protein [Coprinopsis sp. MPI-PUGE-AT-0042]